MTLSLAETRTNRILRILCVVMFAFHLGTNLVSIAAMPNYYRRVVTRTVPEIQMAGSVRISSAVVAEEAALRGLSLRDYALYRIARDLVYAAGFMLVGILIALRAGRSWFLWFTAMILVFVAGGNLFTYVQVAGDWSRYFGLFSFLWPAFALFLYLFPNGKAVPRWLLWAMAPFSLFHFFFQFAFSLTVVIEKLRIDSRMVEALTPLILVPFPLALAGQVYRYLRISTPTEKLQTRWVLYGLAVMVLLNALPLYGKATFDLQKDFGYSSDISVLIFLLIPLTIGISILRRRLWDIDLIIRRTLVYGVLTVLLALLYFGGVVLLQALLRMVTGETSPAAVVISTLAIAALFTPLRARIQQVIDRRFFRSRYDAENLVQGFSARLQNEVDLGELSSSLLGVTAEALQPESASLWIRRETDPRGKR